MTSRNELTLWCIAAMLATTGAAIVRRPLASDDKPALVQRQPRGRDGSDGMDYNATSIVRANPFRLDRGPAPVAFSLTPQLAPSPVPTAPVMKAPTLVLRGIAGGPPWQALVDGIPGREGATVVKAGDRIGELRVTSINRDTVIMSGMDTTWKLTMVRAWR